MPDCNDIDIREAERSDLVGSLRVQHEGFGRIAKYYDIDPQLLPPIQEELEDLERLADQGTRFFIAVDAEGRVVGTVRGQESGDTVEIGRLAVSARFLRRGVATRLMRALEAAYPDARTFRLFTGAEAHEPLSLYRKLGYEVTDSQDSGHVQLVWLEKRRSKPVS